MADPRVGAGGGPVGGGLRVVVAGIGIIRFELSGP